tara:strand:- start:1990 stop:4131 length:2142 start_codon:yes stop_codon:yes gene_type:complete
MATYVNDLRLKEIGTGESSGTWGTETNVNLELIGDAMGYATKSIANASTATITMPDGTASNGELRSLYLKLTGGGQACTVTLGPNTVNKVWIVENATSYTLTFSMGSGANVAVGAGLTKVIAGDGAGSGADILDVLKNMSLGGDLTISGTFNPTGDTASGDDAAFGYASADGAILTGQGSTSDVTLKNDADGTVLTIPTGTTNVDIVGTATAATFEPDGDTAAGDNAAIGYTSAEGLILTGQGSTNDVTIKNDADADVIEIPTGTVNVTVAGDLIAAGTLQATGDTAAGDDAAIGYTAAEGLILTGQGSTNDVTIKNDADTDVIEIPTGTVKAVIAGLVEISAGDIAIKNSGTVSTVKFYCEQSNAHYAQIQAPAHSAFSGNVTLVLPATSDTLAGIAATQTLSNKTLAHPLISGDTAAGDDAALGYTSAEGIIVTGQGSTSDVTLKNDADGTVLTIPTGTTNVDVVGDFTAGTLNADGDTAAGDGAAIGYTAAEGLILTGQGSTNDVTIKNDADADVIEIPTGTTNVTIAGTLDVGGAKAKVAGLETIYVPAAAMYPETTNGSSDLEQVELSNGPELKCLDFAAAADDFAQFQVIFPKSWNEGTVTFQAFFTVTGTNTGTVAWGLAGRSYADSADLNTAFGTQVVATAKAHSGTSNDIDVAAVSGAVTLAGAAADCLTIFQIARDVSADTQTGAARLLGIKLFFTTDAANDA